VTDIASTTTEYRSRLAPERERGAAGDSGAAWWGFAMIPADNTELDQLTIEHDARQGERVLKQIYDLLGRFVSYPDEESRVAHTLWCVHAHLMHLWTSTPRLAFLSVEPASGKSRALEITSLLVPNAVLAVNMSPAYLFRRVGEREGTVTILFDEIDTVFGPKAKENEEIRGNAGHRRGAIAGRCVMRGRTVETEDCPAYAALAVAGLGWLPDTLMSRSIVIRMRRRAADERVEPYRPRLHDPQGAAVRHQIETWTKTLTEIDLDAINLPPEVEDRDADCWEPLLAIAEAAGGNWPERGRRAAVKLVEASKDREASLGVRLLTDIQQAFVDTIVLSTKELIRRLIEIPESAWGDLRGKPLDERGLSHRLRQYDIRSRKIRFGDTTMMGYRREDFADAWRRYVSPSGTHAKSGTSGTLGTNEQNQSQNVPDAKKCSGRFDRGVPDVPDGVPDRGPKNIGGNNGVPDVPDVPILPGDGEGPDPDDYTFHLDDDYQAMPEFLVRRQ
jgi:Protein of unknown function (DUF3631)